MGYNKDNYKRIKELYETKYRCAQEEAETRRYELWARLPALEELDRAVSALGLEAVKLTIGGGASAPKRIAALKEQSLELQAARGQLLRENGYPEDYTAIHYDCEKCGDTGYVDTRMCDCMRRALILAGYESSGIATLMQTQRFDTFSLDYYRDSEKTYEGMKRIYDVMQQFAQSFSTNTQMNLALFGGTGLGKTHLSTAVAKTVIDRGFDVLYISAVGMLASFERERFGTTSISKEDVDTSRFYDCDLLIVDDLGSEVSNQFTVSAIYNVINIRLNKKKPTIISTNLTPAELRTRYWDRIASRIFGEYTPLIFEGTDVRMQKLKK